MIFGPLLPVTATTIAAVMLLPYAFIQGLKEFVIAQSNDDDINVNATKFGQMISGIYDDISSNSIGTFTSENLKKVKNYFNAFTFGIDNEVEFARALERSLAYYFKTDAKDREKHKILLVQQGKTLDWNYPGGALQQYESLTE